MQTKLHLPKPRIETLILKVIDQDVFNEWMQSHVDQTATHGCIVQAVGMGNYIDQVDELEDENAKLKAQLEKIRKQIDRMVK